MDVFWVSTDAWVNKVIRQNPLSQRLLQANRIAGVSSVREAPVNSPNEIGCISFCSSALQPAARRSPFARKFGS
jgi:hypothetical protein